MSTRFTDGNVSMTLDGGMEQLVRRAVEAASKGSVQVLEAKGAALAQQATAAWYGPNGVYRVTGASGDIEVVTTVSETEVRVSVGSTDTELVRGKPRAMLVHRAGPLSRRKGVNHDGKYLVPELITKPARAALAAAVSAIADAFAAKLGGV